MNPRGVVGHRQGLGVLFLVLVVAGCGQRANAPTADAGGTQFDGGVADAGLGPDGGLSAADAFIAERVDAGYTCAPHHTEPWPYTCDDSNLFCINFKDRTVLRCSDDLDTTRPGVQVSFGITSDQLDQFSILGNAFVHDELLLEGQGLLDFREFGRGVFTLQSGKIEVTVGEAGICRASISITVEEPDGGCPTTDGGPGR